MKKIMKKLLRIFLIILLWSGNLGYVYSIEADVPQHQSKRVKSATAPAAAAAAAASSAVLAQSDGSPERVLSIATGSGKGTVISFLNSFIPAFCDDPVKNVEKTLIVVPGLRLPKENQAFIEMNLHVVSSKGGEYIVEMQAQRHVMSEWRSPLIREYQTDIKNREAYATVLAVERAEGEAAGIEKGIEKGRAEERTQMILGMIQAGLDDATILRIPGITADELTRIRSQL